MECTSRSYISNPLTRAPLVFPQYSIIDNQTKLPRSPPPSSPSFPLPRGAGTKEQVHVGKQDPQTRKRASNIERKVRTNTSQGVPRLA
jgi:hypothetical protein